MDDSLARHNTGLMPYLVAASQILGVAALAVTGTWLSQYRGGFSWDGPQQFNVHPICMVLGMVFLCGDALLVYRVFRHESKKATKILHGALHMLALIISVVGIIAVFQFHKKKDIPDMYSLHSWLGITTFTLYILQDNPVLNVYPLTFGVAITAVILWPVGEFEKRVTWICGFVMFFVPGIAFAYKSRFKPLHVFLGLSLLVSTIATCLLGLTEKLLFALPEEYSKLPAEGVLCNTLGLLLVAFGLVMSYILTRDEWRRPPLPEEQALSIDFKTLTEGESPNEP